jgi:hypothetical protein
MIWDCDARSGVRLAILAGRRKAGQPPSPLGTRHSWVQTTRGPGALAENAVTTACVTRLGCQGSNRPAQ